MSNSNNGTEELATSPCQQCDGIGLEDVGTPRVCRRCLGSGRGDVLTAAGGEGDIDLENLAAEGVNSEAAFDNESPLPDEGSQEPTPGGERHSIGLGMGSQDPLKVKPLSSDSALKVGIWSVVSSLPGQTLAQVFEHLCDLLGLDEQAKVAASSDADGSFNNDTVRTFISKSLDKLDKDGLDDLYIMVRNIE